MSDLKHLLIVGCGGIAKFHAKLLRKRHPDIQLSFASRTLARAEAYRAEFMGARAYGSYEEAFASPDIDTVMLCTPNGNHCREAVAALQAGKHVILEKPITNTTAEANEILAAAKRTGRRVRVAENHRYRPSILELDRRIRAGEVGTVKFIRMTVMRTHKFRAGEWRSNPADIGGGPLIDGGIHWVNALLTLGGGTAHSVQALEAPRTVPNCPGEDSISIQCLLQNGSVGQLTYSWGVASSNPLKFIGVYGDRGTLYVSNTGMFGLALGGGRLPRPILLPFSDWKGYEAMWRDLIETSTPERAQECLVTGDIGLRDLAFVEAAYTSVAETQSGHSATSAQRAGAGR